MGGAGFDFSQEMASAISDIQKGVSIEDVARRMGENSVFGFIEHVMRSPVIPSVMFEMKGDDIIFAGNVSFRALLKSSENAGNGNKEEKAFIQQCLSVAETFHRNPNIMQAVVFSPDIGFGRGYIQVFTRDANGKGQLNVIESSKNHQEYQAIIRDIFGTDVPKIGGGSGRQLYQTQFRTAGNELAVTSIIDAIKRTMEQSSDKEYANKFLARFVKDTISNEISEWIKTMTELIKKIMLQCRDPLRAIELICKAQEDLIKKIRSAQDFQGLKLPNVKDFLNNLQSTSELSRFFTSRSSSSREAQYSFSKSESVFAAKSAAAQLNENKSNIADRISSPAQWKPLASLTIEEHFQKLIKQAAYFKEIQLTSSAKQAGKDQEVVKDGVLSKLHHAKFEEFFNLYRMYVLAPVAKVLGVTFNSAVKVEVAIAANAVLTPMSHSTARELNVNFGLNLRKTNAEITQSGTTKQSKTSRSLLSLTTKKIGFNKTLSRKERNARVVQLKEPGSKIEKITARFKNITSSIKIFLRLKLEVVRRVLSILALKLQRAVALKIYLQQAKHFLKNTRIVSILLRAKNALLARLRVIAQSKIFMLRKLTEARRLILSVKEKLKALYIALKRQTVTFKKMLTEYFMRQVRYVAKRIELVAARAMTLVRRIQRLALNQIEKLKLILMRGFRECTLVLLRKISKIRTEIEKRLHVVRLFFKNTKEKLHSLAKLAWQSFAFTKRMAKRVIGLRLFTWFRFVPKIKKLSASIFRRIKLSRLFLFKRKQRIVFHNEIVFSNKRKRKLKKKARYNHLQKEVLDIDQEALLRDFNQYPISTIETLHNDPKSL